MQVLIFCSTEIEKGIGRPLQSFEPPSTATMSPVIQRASSETRKAMTEATSAGVPIRLRLCIPMTTARPSSVLVKFDMSVSITPGATALTRMPRAEGSSEILHQRVDGALRAGVSRQRADRRPRSERRQEHDGAAAAEHRQQLLEEKIRGADVDGEEIIEVLDRDVLEPRRVGNPRVRHDDVEPVADQAAHLRGKPVGAVRGGEVGGDSIGAPAGRANLADDRLGFIGVATVVDDDARAGGGKRERGRTAHSARPAGDESGLVGEAGHGGISPGNVTSRRGTVHTSLASSVISAFRALETGQFFSASPAIRANVAWSRFGTLARSDKAERVMRKP
jgi:hypothetical protein